MHLSAQDIDDLRQRSIFERPRESPSPPLRIWRTDSEVCSGYFEKRAKWEFLCFALPKTLWSGVFSNPIGVLQTAPSILIDTAT